MSSYNFGYIPIIISKSGHSFSKEMVFWEHPPWKISSKTKTWPSRENSVGAELACHTAIEFWRQQVQGDTNYRLLNKKSHRQQNIPGCRAKATRCQAALRMPDKWQISDTKHCNTGTVCQEARWEFTLPGSHHHQTAYSTAYVIQPYKSVFLIHICILRHTSCW